MNSKYFSQKEMLYLPSWGIMHIPNQEEIDNINKAAAKFDVVREFLNKPINIHCWIRPSVVNCPGSKYHGKNYNAAIGGAAHSAHILGLAIDFDCGEDCDDTRHKLLPMLEDWGLRMEDTPGSNWVHLGSDWQPGMNHYFKP